MNKKILITLFVILTVIISISTVCANDVNTTVSNENLPVSENKLNESSFNDLEKIIVNSTSDKVNLDKDYSFNNETDEKYITSGVLIKKK